MKESKLIHLCLLITVMPFFVSLVFFSFMVRFEEGDNSLGLEGCFDKNHLCSQEKKNQVNFLLSPHM